MLAASLVVATSVTVNAQSDPELNQKIESLEAKITKVKSEIPEADKKKYFSSISDVENRKNNLKSMMKTPVEKRDKNWQQTWDQNYLKANERIDKVKEE
jgi:hypothetical protein